MANFVAFSAFDATQINLFFYEQFFLESSFFNNVNTLYRGTVYEDVLEVIGGDEFEADRITFGGTGITVNADGAPTGGTVTGVVEANDLTDAEYYFLEGISLSAVSIYNASQTSGRADDIALLAQALSGNDTITLSNADDVMNGYAGDDVMNGGGGDDILNGGTGHDQVRGEAGNDTLIGGSGNDLLNGGTGDDVLRGNGGNDRMFGDAGLDLLVGGNGMDQLFGGNDRDILKGGSKADELNGGSGNDKLIGNAGNDLLEGKSGNDVMSGGSGDDTLDGGSGRDIYKGLGGADIFIFAAGYDRDIVKDFEDGFDRIDLSSFGFADAATAKSFASTSGSDVVFDFGSGDVLIVKNVALGDLGDADLIL